METAPSLAVKHYGLTEWVDFARRLTNLAKSREMHEHLAQGCAQCQDLADFCSCLQRLCGTMLATGAPDWVTRRASAIFPLRDIDSRKSSFIVPKLVFENFGAPSAIGLRTGSNPGWQALYQAGDYALDIRIDPDPATTQAATLVGQILNHAAPESNPDGMPVLLKSGKSVVAHARCNRFGEFQLSYRQRRRLRLVIYLEQESKGFRIPVQHFASGLSAPKVN